MFNYQNLLEIQILGNTGKDYLIALGVFIVSLAVLKVFREVVLHKLKKAAEKTKTDLDDVLIGIIHDIKPSFYFLASVYIALNFLAFPIMADRIINGLFVVAVVFQAVMALQTFIDYWTGKLISRKEGDENAQNKGAVKSISYLLKILVWVFASLAVLSNLGFNITSLIAGLGIGGFAIAFALQNILQDIFSSFSILIDKPFKIGDFIIIGGDMGVVGKIGIKSTRIKTLQGQELIISNRELTNTRVNNYKKMEKRRIAFSFGVLYETSTEKLKKIPGIVRDIVAKEKLAELDRVHFKEFGDFSLGFEVVYYMQSPDFNEYRNTQQSINFALKEVFEAEGIDFAYPTQTLLIKKQ